jgi:DNA polymerase-4
MRILCVLMPHFPLACEVLRDPTLAGRPAIVTRAEGSSRLVLDFSPELAGLRPDMPLQAALARHGRVELVPADLPHYRAVFRGLLDKLEEVTPLVEGVDLGLAYLGASGMHLIYPDEDTLIDAVYRVIPKVFRPQAGLAGNKFLAYLAARRCPPGGHRVLAGDSGAFLRELTCDDLPVSLKAREKLRGFGIATLGDLMNLPTGPLMAQFGPEGKRLAELALGIDNTPLYPRLLERAIEESATLPSVTVSLPAILVAIEEMLSRIFRKIAPLGLGVGRLCLWTRTWNAEHWERLIRFKEPAMELKTALGRIRRVLEDYPQPGPVEQAGLRVEQLACPRGRQESLFREVRARDHLADDIRRLESRQGAPQVYRVKEVEPWSRLPERRYVLAPTDR